MRTLSLSVSCFLKKFSTFWTVFERASFDIRLLPWCMGCGALRFHPRGPGPIKDEISLNNNYIKGLGISCILNKFTVF